MSTSNIKKSKRQSLLALLLIVALTITGVFAFLTATTDTKENKFTVGNIKIDIDEGPWDYSLTVDTPNENGETDGIPDGDTNTNGIPDYAENIVSGMIMEKAPRIINTGSNEAWVYFLVQIPVADVVIAADNGSVEKNEDGTVKITENAELFKLYKSNGAQGYTEGYNDVAWEELEGAVKETYTEIEGQKYINKVYACKNKIAASTESDTTDETSALFDAVRFANVTEAFATATTEPLAVKVTGLAIQTDTSFDDHNDAWAALVADNGMADYPIQAVSAQG